MLTFMEHIQQAFFTASSWDVNNCYGTLTATANSLLDFELPRGIRLNVSSLSTPNFAASYTLGSRGVVDGSLCYLYTSLPLHISSASQNVDLQRLVRSYRNVSVLTRPDEDYWGEIWHRGRRTDKKDTLLYGRLHLPQSALEALYLRRISPTRLLRLAAVSDSSLPTRGALLATVQNDHAKYSTEYLFSTDSALIGVRALYNIGHDPRVGQRRRADEPGAQMASTSQQQQQQQQHGRLSAGAEAYFSPVNKSGGMSTAVRFTTLPLHAGFPYTMTLTLNPLMGNISSAWAARASDSLGLCSRFNFNFYSYESDVQIGMELWRRKIEAMEHETQDPKSSSDHDRNGPFDSVIKVKAGQDCKVGVLWEGRINGLLASIGADIDLKRRERIIGALGIELSYSS